MRIYRCVGYRIEDLPPKLSMWHQIFNEMVCQSNPTYSFCVRFCTRNALNLIEFIVCIAHFINILSSSLIFICLFVCYSLFYSINYIEIYLFIKYLLFVFIMFAFNSLIFMQISNKYLHKIFNSKFLVFNSLTIFFCFCSSFS